MNYKDLIGIKNPNFRTLAYIPNFCKIQESMYKSDDDASLKIHQVFKDKIIASVGAEGTKEIYDIKSVDGKKYIIPDNDKYNKVCLDDIVFLGVIGEIHNNKIYSEYFRQGDIYKNYIVFEKTKHLSKEELDKLPLINKICYIPEFAFEGKEYIDLNSKDLKDGEDYFTIFSIKEAIKNYCGNDIYKNISKNDLDDIVEDVYETLDWQYPTSLIYADNYLDGYIEYLNAKNEESNAIKKTNNSKDEEAVETYGF